VTRRVLETAGTLRESNVREAQRPHARWIHCEAARQAQFCTVMRLLGGLRKCTTLGLVDAIAAHKADSLLLGEVSAHGWKSSVVVILSAA
jgi:hypothetical protein